MKIQWNADDYNKRRVLKICVNHNHLRSIFGRWRGGFTWANPMSAPVYELDVNLKSMITEAAYYKAEKRAFKPGNELRDWLEAEREIISMVYGEKCIRQQANPFDRPSMQGPFTLC